MNDVNAGPQEPSSSGNFSTQSSQAIEFASDKPTNSANPIKPLSFAMLAANPNPSDASAATGLPISTGTGSHQAMIGAIEAHMSAAKAVSRAGMSLASLAPE
eukprot:CAMPEP_0197860040 /NCGR_PEP_ID=MMETSP1438-20131217/35128_1 /TAXON_ID=1461541 /ORGANISM="Pterosperma sp., Strain CCMP1384" /LENGTH=101 /DNA_ID=CAMNT_0043476755 /DNA_START=73 /DNA_END=375 /DNA_ORIENTATION=-